MRPFKSGMRIALPLLLAGCALGTPPTAVDPQPASQWYAPLPHQGSAAELVQWWRQQGDPLLTTLIASGQQVSPTVAAAANRIGQAQAARVAAGAALLPRLDAGASASRSSAQPAMPLATTLQAGLQTAWELDVFGAGRYGRARAQAQLDAARAGWHEARVAVAAEIATRYYGLRACEQLLAINQADAASRAETARLAQLSAGAGFTAPATAALARASAAESHGRVTQQRASCDIEVKTLVALTAMPEPTLRQQLAQQIAPLPLSAAIAVASLPAHLLRQRPDLYAAERDVAAASAAIGSAEAQRYPRLSLSGALGLGSIRSGGNSVSATTWTVGPLALSLPLFDGGLRTANVAAARASYDEAAVSYRAKVRQAVREVEEALVNLDSNQVRAADAQSAADGYRASFDGTAARYRSGLANLVELEEAHRLKLAADTALVTVQQQRSTAWIALYRAVGGGWKTEPHD